jgi:glutaredoxin
MTSHQVKLFSLSTCSHCKSVKELLKRYDQPVDVIDIDRLDKDERGKVLKEVKQYNARVSFPTTVIGDEVIVGYRADQIKKALEKN